MTDQGKNNTKIILAALGIVTAVITLILAPTIRANSSTAEQQAVILQRLATLEGCTRRIDALPEKVAAQTEAISGLRASVDRLEKKLDDHVGRGK